jgi:hypothetical protein
MFAIARGLMSYPEFLLRLGQNESPALRIEHYGYVLEDEGRNLLKNDKVRRAYLGIS